MKNLVRPVSVLLFTFVCATLLSFSLKFGGDSYTIHLNNKQLVQHYVHSKSSTPSISLNPRSGTDQVSVYYSECGKIGSQRKLTLKDNQDNILKEWGYANAKEEHTPMTFTTKEVTAANKNKVNTLKLYYTSNEVSNGRLLATISLGDAAASTRK
jgi:hypothetical protein